MQVSVESEKQVTVDELVGIADAIYADARAGMTLETGSKKYPEFAKSYPIVHKYIFKSLLYYSSVFRQWLVKFAKNPFKNEDEYLEHQADYVRRLFHKQNPKARPQDARDVFTQTLLTLKKERDDFKAALEEVKLAVERRDQLLGDKNRRELAEYIKNMPPMGSLAVQADVPMEEIPAVVAEFSLPPLETTADSLLL